MYKIIACPDYITSHHIKFFTIHSGDVSIDKSQFVGVFFIDTLNETTICEIQSGSTSVLPPKFCSAFSGQRGTAT